jgi:hypothetical protein
MMKRKHVSVSMSICCQNRNTYPFPLLESWKQKCVSVSICLWSIVQKNDPAKMGRAKLHAMGRFTRGQKKDFFNIVEKIVSVGHVSATRDQLKW